MKQAASIRALKLPVLPPGIAISTGARRLRPHQADADREIRRQYLADFRRGALRLRRLALSTDTDSAFGARRDTCYQDGAGNARSMRPGWR
jgi:hypothetical protein